MAVTRRVVLTGFVALAVGVLGFDPEAHAGQPTIRPTTSPTCSTAGTQLQNASFELPDIPSPGPEVYFFNQASVLGWSTTASDRQIEIWHSNTHDNITNRNIPPAQGDQFVELNANMVSALYQDIQTTPGAVLTWGLSHRGRAGTDTMRVLIGPSGGSLVQRASITNGNTAWGRHSGSYTVPPGQTCTRFQFEAVSAAGGPTVGNFLDAISFGTPAELEIDTSVSPTGEVNVGDTLTYDIAVQNVGGSATVNAVVSNALPDHLTFVPGSGRMIRGATETVLSDAIHDEDARTVTSQVSSSAGSDGVIEPGDTVVLRYQATVTSGAGGSVVENSPTVTSTDGLGVVTTTPSPPIVTTVNTTADTTIFLEATDSAQPGEPVEYTATARNLGPQPALIGPSGEAAAEIVVTVPAQIEIDSASLPAECSAALQVVTCSRYTTLSPYTGSVITDWAMTFGGTVRGEAGAGVASASATVTTNTFDYALGNNTTSAATGITLPLPATLAVEKILTTPIVTAGENGSLQIVVSNVGDFSTASVELTEEIPSGFTVTAAMSTAGSCIVTSLISCALGPIAAGADVTVTVSGATSSTLAPGSSLEATAIATDTVTTATATDAISIQAAAALVLTKGTTGPTVADQPVAYNIVVTNLGPSSAHNAVIEDDLPAGTSLVALPAGCTATGLHLECEIGTIGVGASTTLTYQLTPPEDGGSITNSAQVDSESTLLEAENATDSVTTEIATDADIEVTHTTDRSTLASGDTARLTITVTNHGPMTATDVVVEAARTTGIAYTAGSATTATGTVAPGDDPFWTIGTLAVGASATATIDVTVTGEPGIYTHTVTVSATQEDLGAVNDSALVALTIPTPDQTTSDSDPADPTADPTTGPASAQSATLGMGDALARTGEDSGPLTTTGLLFSVLGIALLGTARRLRAHRPPPGPPRCIS